MSDLYIGLMSGTSLDGIDAGLVDFADGKCELIAFYYQPFDDPLKNQLHQLSRSDIPVLLSDYGTMDTQLGRLFGETVNLLLSKAQIPSHEIEAIGSHGLTVHHAPQSNFPFSLQIGDPNIIAETTGITTVADFRRRDIAAHGQGAPLVPAFHRAFFGQRRKNLCVVNIGGIANITVLSEDKALGFDTGPGNTLMDYWTRKNLGKSHDQDGDWGRSGRVHPPLLQQMKSDPYFRRKPAKSTGKEYFSESWLMHHLETFDNLQTADVQATLCRLTADTICSDIEKYAAESEEGLICGGGCHNRLLFETIANSLNFPVRSTAVYGIDPDHVEAIAFAWLAMQTMHDRPGNLPEATGADTPVVLGGIYPGKRGLNRKG